MAAPIPIRIQRKQRRPRYQVIGPSLIAVLAAAGLWFVLRPAHRAGPQPLVGYVSTPGTLDQEYARFQGKPLKDEDASRQFQRAAALTAAMDYRSAAELLENVAKRAPVPVVFNDLGILYAQLDDRSRAVNAFRDALARDLMYQPVRFNLNRLRGFTAESADPVSVEVEPNNALIRANVIALNKPVEAAIEAGQDDVDSFRFIAPRAPRDILLLEIANHSATLAPMVSFFGEDNRFLDWGKTEHKPGAMLSLRFSPEPNVALALQVRGYAGTAGAYVLTVRALNQFDAYEPNDDIMSARRIAINQKIDANIMDARDTDYYSFTSPVNGAVTVAIENRADTLVPALSTFTPDLRASGFADLRGGEKGIAHEIQVLAGLTYYIQVWSRANTSGEYSLTVKDR